MSTTVNNDGWNEWSRHVLKALERLDVSYQQISSDVSDLKGKVTNYNPDKLTRLEVEVHGLRSNDSIQETRLREVEQKALLSSVNLSKIPTLEKTVAELEKREAHFSGKWAVLALVGAAIVSVVVSIFSRMLVPQHYEKKSQSTHIEKALSPQELAGLQGPS